MAVLGAAGLEAGPSAVAIDSQSAWAGAIRGASIDCQGFDEGKKVTSRKQHIMVDTLGLTLGIVVHPGDAQDRNGARELLRHTGGRIPFIEVISPTAVIGDRKWRQPSP